MIRMTRFSMDKAEYAEYPLCSRHSEAHGPLSCPNKATYDR